MTFLQVFQVSTETLKSKDQEKDHWHYWCQHKNARTRPPWGIDRDKTMTTTTQFSKPDQQRAEMLKWLEATAHSQPRFDMGIGDASKVGESYFRRDGLRGLSIAEVCHRVGFLKAANSVGVDAARRPLNIYICAATLESQSWLMLDDLNLTECIRIAGERAHMIVQTSQGRHHLWLATSRPVTIDERKICQQVMQHRFGGDAASTSGDHFGRLAGFKNVKRNCWVNLVEVKHSDRRADVDKLLSYGEGFDSLSPLGGVVSPRSDKKGCNPPLMSPSTARLSLPSEFVSDGRDESSAEFAFACVYLQKRLNIEEGIQLLAQRAMERKKRNSWSGAEAYARKTFAAAELRLKR